MTKRPLWLTIPLLALIAAVVLWTRCNADDKKPPAEPQSAEIASLKAQITSLQAELKLLQMQFSLEMQVCSAPELMSAKLAAVQARDAVTKQAGAKPAPPAPPAPKPEPAPPAK